jgi:hypothetical protein
MLYTVIEWEAHYTVISAKMNNSAHSLNNKYIHLQKNQYTQYYG